MKLIHTLLILSVSFGIFGQDTLIVFDRPGVADSPYLVPEKTYFLENGIGVSDQTEALDFLYPSVMLRKRMFKTTEIRIATSTFPQSVKLINQNIGVNPIVGSVGFKQRICNEKKWKPETALILNTYYNFSSPSNFKLTNFIWESQFLFQSTITNWFSINYNIGYIHLLKSKQHVLNQSTCFNFQLLPKLGLFIENFNYFGLNEKSNEFCYDFGFTYLISRNLQFDISYIANHYKEIHYGTLLTGISWSFSKKQNSL